MFGFSIKQLLIIAAVGAVGAAAAKRVQPVNNILKL